MSDPLSEWYPDPTGRFDERFLLRGEWSVLVRTAGVEHIDQPPADLPLPAEIAAPLVEPPAAEPLAQPVTTVAAGSLPPPSPGTAFNQMASAGPADDDQPVGARRKRWRVVVAIVVVVVLLGTGVAVGVSRFRDDDPPTSWDPRLTELVAFVEKTRGLTFKRAVPVEFLTSSAFDAALAADDRAAVAADSSNAAASDADSVRELRALRLVDGEVDLAEAQTAINNEIVGYYTFEERKIFVRGNELTATVRSTLVHELTHALQDEYFGEAMRSDVATDDAELARRSLIEGDALNVENAYYDTLPAADQKQIDALFDTTTAAGESGDAVPTAPGALEDLFAVPYALGPSLVAILRSHGGQDSLDAAFTSPPPDSRFILDPSQFIDGRKRAAHSVETPKLDTLAKVIEETDVGPALWYFILDQYVGDADARWFADHWLADRSIGYSLDDRVCVATTVLVDDTDTATGATNPTSIARAGAVLATWASKATGSNATVEAIGNAWTLVSCDPGAAATTPVEPDALERLATRAALMNELISNEGLGGQPGLVSCYANAVMDNFTLDQINQSSQISSAMQTALEQLASNCAR